MGKGNKDLFSTKKLLSISGLSVFLKTLGASLSFAFTFLIARWLGAEQNGIYMGALSLLMILSMVARLGLQNPVLKYVSREYIDKNTVSMRKIVNTARTWVISISILIVLSVSVFLWYYTSIGHKQQSQLYVSLTMLSGVPILSLNVIVASGLIAINRILPSVVISSIMVPILSLIFYVVIFNDLEAIGVAIAFLLANLLTLIWSTYIWNKHTKQNGLETLNNFRPKDMWSSAHPLWITKIINNGVLPWGSVFILSLSDKTFDAGILGVAMRVSLTLGFILKSVNSILGSRFAYLHKQEKMDEFKNLAKRATVILSLLALPLFLVIFCYADALMSLAGPEYTTGSTALIIIAIGQLISVMCGPNMMVLAMTGHERELRTATVITGIIFISLMSFFALGGSVNDAALTVCISTIINNILCLYFMKKKLGFTTVPFIK